MSSSLRPITLSLALLLGAHLSAHSQVEPEQVPPVGLSTVNFPEVNLELAAEIGQSIIYRAHVRRFPAISLSSTAEDKPNSPGVTRIAAGDIPLYKVSNDGKFYRDSKAVYVMLGAAVATEDSGIFVPTDKAKPAVIYHYRVGGMFGLGKGYTFGTIPVSVSDEFMKEAWSTSSFRRELVYGGIFQNVLTLSYREFKDDVARPAFTQELKYDLAQGNVVGYKGARFEVVSATNTELKYKVIKHID